ncbi:MAG: hypothetical protein ACLRHW_09345 [Coprobacillus cateniformis]
MVFDTKIMQDFLDENESHYVGKYRFHSGYELKNINLRIIIICLIKTLDKLIFM